MTDIETLRRRIDQEFDGECHLTSKEARLLFDVYEAACAWRDDRQAALHRQDERADQLAAAVDLARSAP